MRTIVTVIFLLSINHIQKGYGLYCNYCDTKNDKLCAYPMQSECGTDQELCVSLIVADAETEAPKFALMGCGILEHTCESFQALIEISQNKIMQCNVCKEDYCNTMENALPESSWPTALRVYAAATAIGDGNPYQAGGPIYNPYHH